MHFGQQPPGWRNSRVNSQGLWCRARGRGEGRSEHSHQVHKPVNTSGENRVALPLPTGGRSSLQVKIWKLKFEVRL